MENQAKLEGSGQVEDAMIQNTIKQRMYPNSRQWIRETLEARR